MLLFPGADLASSPVRAEPGDNHHQPAVGQPVALLLEQPVVRRQGRSSQVHVHLSRAAYILISTATGCKKRLAPLSGSKTAASTAAENCSAEGPASPSTTPHQLEHRAAGLLIFVTSGRQSYPNFSSDARQRQRDSTSPPPSMIDLDGCA